MRSTLGISLQSLSVIGAIGALLMGCPVWSEGGDDDGRIPIPGTDAGVTDSGPADTGPRSCTADSQCTNGYCNRPTGSSAGTCTPSNACTSATGCPSGFACDSRGVCVPGCTTNAQCAALGAGLVCDPTTRQCAPGGRCTTDAQCASATPSTPVCLGGSCQPRTNQCQFDYQCTGQGQACVDGQCVVTGCTAANAATVCAAGQVCTNGRCGYPSSGQCATPCATGTLCVSGACLRTCSADAQCGTGQFCDYGVCRVDTRPRPFCTMDSQCTAGSVCYNGACRRTCPMPGVGTDGACMTVDVQFNLCRPDNMNRSLCTSTNEVTPECARTADCMAGRACVNARCQ